MSNANKQRGSGWETRLVARAKRCGLKARRQPGSGQFKGYPNDAVIEDILVECKMRTAHPTMTQMMEWLADVHANTNTSHEYVAGVVAYNHKGSRRPVVLMNLDTFLGLLCDRIPDSEKGG